MMPRWARIRISLLIAVMAFGLGAVLYRAHLLQVRQSRKFVAMASEQYLSQVRLPPRRGTISDRHGQILAVSVDVDSIWANPRQVGSKAPWVARELARSLDLDESVLLKRLGEQRYFAWVKRQATSEQVRRVMAMRISGVHTVKESRRFYPNREIGASTIGFVGVDSVGLEGIERAMDGHLRGSADEVLALRDALGREIFPSGLPEAAVRQGSDVELTLDLRIQHLAEVALRQAIDEYGARAAWMVVTDPRNGEILALVSLPGYNPNEPAGATADLRRNRAVTDMFEPGSTAKVFTFAAALEAGVVHENERFFCENGNYRIGGRTIRDAHSEGWLNLGEVMAKSSNICTAKIAQRLGKQRLHAVLERLGVGRKLGIELLGEVGGVLHSPSTWSEVALANVAFGQGFTVTALQMAAGLGAIANGGTLVEPRLIREIRKPRGKAISRTPPARRRVLEPAVARRLIPILEQVTEPGGTGTRAAIPGFSVAGKTGTAQKVDPVTGGYSDDRWIASFVGFAPASNPRLLAIIVVDEPQGEVHYGGLIAAPVFRALAEPALRYLGVPNDRELTVATQTAARAHEPAKGARPASNPVELVESGPNQAAASGLSVPDFTGMSMAEALEAARRVGLELELIGTGRAIAQSPGPGPQPPGVRVRVQFEPPG